MVTTHWTLNDDLPPSIVACALALFVLALGALVAEVILHPSRRWRTAATGVTAVLLLGLAVLRPLQVQSSELVEPAEVAIVVDASRRLELPDGDWTRAQLASIAVERLRAHFASTHLSLFTFGDGQLRPLATSPAELTTWATYSTLGAAVADLEHRAVAPPEAVIVVSDGRWSKPAAEDVANWAAQSSVPLHTVRVTEAALADAAIRGIRSAAVAVAHQPLSITVEAACSGDLTCSTLPVRVAVLQDSRRQVLAQGVVDLSHGQGTIELEISLDQAGSHVLEISLGIPPGDRVVANNSYYRTFSVTRDRVRLLHLAGRPTYDVRALRRWLKSDQSVDVVAFFILRDVDTDVASAAQSELSLIQFPVDELFTQHLPSFDAIVLQDIDAKRYRLDGYLAPLARYVQNGGGLIMVGGPSSFAGGNYAGTPLDSILPVEPVRSEPTFDASAFVPQFTSAGAVSAVTRTLRDLLGTAVPAQLGTNRVGPARPDAMVLWSHPQLRAGQSAMPVLALGEAGNGRTIALSVDSTHRLAFGPEAARVSGRAYGALWDGLLGWLMRDPRYEALRLELVAPCVEVEGKAEIRLTRDLDTQGPVELTLSGLGDDAGTSPTRVWTVDPRDAPSLTIPIDGLKAGGYRLRAKLPNALPGQFDFACQPGAGEAWSDTRPGPQEMLAVASSSGGRSVRVDDVGDLPLPPPRRVAMSRATRPLAPPWVWTLTAALALGAHWFVRRGAGLA